MASRATSNSMRINSQALETPFVSLFLLSTRPCIVPYAVKSQAPGLNAHHCGCNAIALTPLWMNRYATSCNLGSAAPTSSPAPVQNTSADDAARGHTTGSKFAGDDCSVHNKCCPCRLIPVSWLKSSKTANVIQTAQNKLALLAREIRRRIEGVSLSQ